jgi:hypothetical protein
LAPPVVESDDDSSSESEEEIKEPKGRGRAAAAKKVPAPRKPVARVLAGAKNIVNNKNQAVAQKRIVN